MGNVTKAIVMEYWVIVMKLRWLLGDQKSLWWYSDCEDHKDDCEGYIKSLWSHTRSWWGQQNHCEVHTESCEVTHTQSLWRHIEYEGTEITISTKDVIENITENDCEHSIESLWRAHSHYESTKLFHESQRIIMKAIQSNCEGTWSHCEDTPVTLRAHKLLWGNECHSTSHLESSWDYTPYYEGHSESLSGHNVIVRENKDIVNVNLSHCDYHTESLWRIYRV